MATYHKARDARSLPIYDFTTQMATLAPPPPEMQQVLAAVHGIPPAMDAFVSVIAGTMSPVEFFDPDHVGRLLTAAAQRSHVSSDADVGPLLAASRP